MDENVRPVRWVGSALRGGSSFNDPRNFRAACRVLEPTGKTEQPRRFPCGPDAHPLS